MMKTIFGLLGVLCLAGQAQTADWVWGESSPKSNQTMAEHCTIPQKPPLLKLTDLNVPIISWTFGQDASPSEKITEHYKELEKLGPQPVVQFSVDE